MKRYKLTLIPEDHVFDTRFDSKADASTFVCQYISNHPNEGLTMFDFRLEEDEMNPTDITSYDKAIQSIGGVEFVTISVDTENKESLSFLDMLMTIARTWNKVDGTEEGFPDPWHMRYFPQFSCVKDYDEDDFCCEDPIESAFEFGIDALLSFRTKELAEEFSKTFKECFAKLFKVSCVS